MSNPTTYKTLFEQVIRSYAPVSNASMELLYEISVLEFWPKGTLLLQVGEVAKALHVICKGAIIAYFIDEKGNTYNKNIFLEKNFAGSKVSCLKETPSEFALETLEDCILLSLNYKKYRELIDNHTDLKDFYIAYLEKNWVVDKEKREISLVMQTATERYLQLLELHPTLDKRIPLHHIASNLGITPTQLSRIRKELKEK
ncbi:Crp/Fnr family transcriptional regulator [Flavobacterium sp. J27]|uniref:Crp/Fnr family transcriptional regulator n=1 Tax=Flavobacterium sp. J27 TaxID=2060419 RepID=UPI00102F5F50|nr:Crp/Fnr family transcriptional regulator [Flavobacterium sp. J27]